MITSWQVGLVSKSEDYKGLIQNIEALRDMKEDDFKALSVRCLEISRTELDFDRQMTATVEFLASL